MPVFDLETDIEYSDHSIRRVPVRINAATREEAVKRIQDGEGEILQVAPSEKRPTRTDQPALYAEPPSSAEKLGGETLYNPTVAPQQTGQPGYIERALRAVGGAALNEGKRIALPTAGALLGEYGGALVPGLNQVPPQLRAAGGSVAGTAANMALGIEKPSLEQLMLSAATPALARGGGSRAIQAIPGAKASYATDFVNQAEALPKIIERGITGNADELFRAAYEANPGIAVPLTRSRAAEIDAKEQLLNIAPQLKHGTQPIAQGLVKAAEQDGVVPLAQLDTVRQAIGAKIGTTSDSVEKGQLKRLYGGILNDLEAAAQAQGGEGAQQLLDGITASRRQFAANDLADLISGPSGAVSRPRPVDGLQTFNAAKVIQEIKNPHSQNELLSQFLEQNPTERTEILDLLEEMNRRNVKLTPVAGTITGSGRNTMVFGAVAGGLKLAGVDSGTAASIAGLAPFALQGLSRALLTAPGRALIRQSFEPSGVLNPLQIALAGIGQSLRQRAGTEPLTTVGTGIHNTLQFGATPGQPQQGQPTQ